MLKFYSRFEINDQTGAPLTDHDMMEIHYNKITALQKAAFVKYPELRQFVLANVASVNTRQTLMKHFQNLRYIQESREHLEIILKYLQDRCFESDVSKSR